MQVKGTNWNVLDYELFDASITGLNQSIATPDQFFCSDNIVTWNRNLSFMYDVEFLDRVKKNYPTAAEQSTIWRIYTLCYFVHIAKKLPGDFVEVGTYKGNTARMVVEETGFNNLNKMYYLYDTFDHADSDINHVLPDHGPNLYQEVRGRFSDCQNVKIIKGYIPESFNQGFPDSISFAHVDLNQAPAEVAALQRILPALVHGGIIVLDDYGWFGYRDQKAAEDPLFEKFGLKVLELPTGQGLVINA